jgi:two-component system CheB/CheR fusion protein
VALGAYVAVAVLINSLTEAQRRLNSTLRVQDRRKSEFMAILGHELRNFLTPMANAVEIVRLRGTGDEMLQQAYATIERQVGNMSRLINDLLDAARINQGKLHLCLEPLDLQSVVTQAVQAAMPLIEARGLHLQTAVPPGPLPLTGDRTRLEQVFINLLTNAVKYTDSGGQLRLAVERKDQGYVVRVQDNGKGIPPEVLPHVFALFVQAEAGSQSGLGIGLSLARELVEMHGGSVAAFSEGRGRGSEFVIRLPATTQGGPVRQQALANN